jgi:SAM-dependent methyltransferase
MGCVIERRIAMTATIRAHNEKAAAVWGSGGSAYDRVSETIADALDHVVARLNPQPGEKCLDVATGTGWTARLLRKRGADVTGVDIGEGVIQAAKKLAPDIDFRIGDAEELEFADGSFDVVTSTFGVMFVANPEDAARELGRVCRTGGRLGLCTWQPGGTIEEWFQVMRPYMPPPPATPPPSPFEWGKPERLRELLGGTFDLEFEEGVTTLQMPNGKAVWDLFVEGYGPTRTTAAGCDPESRAGLERDSIAYMEKFMDEVGVAMPREYLVTIGKRR